MTRTVLVTGASGGIGSAIAHAFATAGDRVAVHYANNKTGADAVLAELPGDGHVLVHGDISDPDVAVRIVDIVVEQAGTLDVLVNNAALGTSWESAHPVPEVSYDDWQKAWRGAVEINLIGTANLSYLAARQMIKQGRGGRIVNVGSRGAYRGEPQHPAYGATKAGLHALGQSLAISLAPHGIAVSSVAPGFVSTDRQTALLVGEHGDAVRAQSPFDRVATPDEVAAAVLYLASQEWVSGAVLDLNGASYLR